MRSSSAISGSCVGSERRLAFPEKMHGVGHWIRQHLQVPHVYVNGPLTT